MKKQLSASILSANPLFLNETLNTLTANGITRLHFDVMDGHFVPNIAFGPHLISSIKNQYPNTEIDCHLMIYPNDAIINAFIKTMPHSIIFHIESCENILSWLKKVPKTIKTGVAIKPGAIPQSLYTLLPILDIVLIMTVEPGFGGQKLIPEQIEIIQSLHHNRTKNHHKFSIMVDGGINRQNAKSIIESGADIIISGADLTQPAEKIPEKIRTFHHILS
ncbi:MAG: ribulose-phosphate 3-epimerase [Gammaproteobacteria bacterium]|jgi:ribulose-phosphate 3-epimerase|nr:ribulose-phosphate 3-epimerase [Gammaproteobacteria bacterium]